MSPILSFQCFKRIVHLSVAEGPLETSSLPNSRPFLGDFGDALLLRPATRLDSLSDI